MLKLLTPLSRQVGPKSPWPLPTIRARSVALILFVGSGCQDAIPGRHPLPDAFSDDTDASASGEAGRDGSLPDADDPRETGSPDTTDDASMPTDAPEDPGTDLVVDGSELCNGVRCVLAPSSECMGPTLRRTYQSPGSCLGGQCVFPYTDALCDNACIWGECLSVPCDDKNCTSAPPDTCKDSGILLSNPPVGTCEPQGCVFASVEVRCSGGCENGRCRSGSWRIEDVVAEPGGGDILVQATVAADAHGNPHFQMVGCNASAYGLQSEVVRSPTGWKVLDVMASTECATGGLAIDIGGTRHFMLHGNSAGVFSYASGPSSLADRTLQENISPKLRESPFPECEMGGLAVDGEGRVAVLAWEKLGVSNSGDQRLAVLRKPIGGDFYRERSASFPFLEGGKLKAVLALDQTGMPVVAVTRYTQTAQQTTPVESILGLPFADGWTFETIPADGVVAGVATHRSRRTRVLLVDGDGFRLALRSELGGWEVHTGSSDAVGPITLIPQEETIGVVYWARDRGLVYATVENTWWSGTTIDSELSPGRSLSLAEDSLGRIHVGYTYTRVGTERLRYARKE